MRKSVVLAMCVTAAAVAMAETSAPRRPASDAIVQFVFTSDSHFGLHRAAFRGQQNVDASVVNAALVASINTLPNTVLPSDGGVGAGATVGPIDFLANGGDIANRAEVTEAGAIQPASVSWAQFQQVYLDGLQVKDHAGRNAAVLAVPGNHDVSNAVGYHKLMRPTVDPTSMVGIYNLVMKPSAPLTVDSFRYPRDRVQTSRDFGGIHFVFLTVWPDSSERAWLDHDLAGVAASTPVILVTHDQPESEPKHFTNPSGQHDINSTDRFENLLVDTFADGAMIENPAVVEQSAFEAFLTSHQSITAYFHGNANWNQFYDWTGPGHTASLHAFRVDSPMKGAQSATDESKLSFQLATIDLTTRRMTVRECLWNTARHTSSPSVVWGTSATVDLTPHRRR